MKVDKINSKKTITNTEFKAIKLKRSTLKMAKPLEEDILCLRKNLPDNKLAKNKKYFGNPNIGPCGPKDSNGGGKEPDWQDAAIAAGLVAAGIAISLL